MPKRDFFAKIQQRNYKTGAYRSPYRKEKGFSRWKGSALIIASLLVLVGGLTFVFAHPLFDLKNVEIRGIAQIQKNEFERTIVSHLQFNLFLFFDRSNRFLFSEVDLQEELMKSYALEEIIVSIHGRIISINIKERTSQFIWISNDQAFIADMHGVIVRPKNPSDDSAMLPVYIDLNNVTVGIGEDVLTQDEVTNTFRFLQFLKESGFVYSHVDVDRLAGKWMRVALQDGYGILFDATGDIESQFRKLQTTLSQIETKPSEYIDLRFGDKIYVK